MLLLVDLADFLGQRGLGDLELVVFVERVGELGLEPVLAVGGDLFGLSMMSLRKRDGPYVAIAGRSRRRNAILNAAISPTTPFAPGEVVVVSTRQRLYPRLTRLPPCCIPAKSPRVLPEQLR